MSAAAPNPNNMLLLVALGIGAYWFMSRRAGASALGYSTLAQQQQAAANNAARNNLLASGVNAIGKLISGFGSSSTTTPTQDQLNLASMLGAYNSSSWTAMETAGTSIFGPVVVPPDAFAFNPSGFTSSYDWIADAWK